eukprot:7194_1
MWQCRTCNLRNFANATICKACFNPVNESIPNRTINDNNGLQSCSSLQRLKKQMRMYIEYDVIDENVSRLLDDFLYLLSMHYKDDEFETIANELGPCDINNCTIFTRHFRDRNKIKFHSVSNHMATKVLDKIHCYYQHCYDIGNKLSSKDLQTIELCETKEINIDDLDETFLNKKIIKMNHILSNKRKLHKTHEYLNRRYNHKYNILLADTDGKKQSDLSNSFTGNKMYSFGVRFHYNHTNEAEPVLHDDHKPVSAKYS